MESLKNDKRESVLVEKQNMIDIMKIFTFLFENGNEETKVALHEGIPPSIYMQQMLLTTDELTANLIKQERSIELFADHTSTCFRTTPNIVIFQQFIPGKSYRVTLSVKNITSCLQYLKIINTKNSWFSLECKAATYRTKLAPGMNVVCDVIFSPEERRDYKFQAVFLTATESFEVPILAIGPRPLLDFPDSVEVPLTAVKIPSVKHLLVRNIGDVPAVFSLSTIRPFAVYPSKGVLAEGETMQVIINFLSDKQGCFKENLFVKYETGEFISLNLYGSAENSVIRIERGNIRMEETYLGLSRSKTFTIHNRSDYVTNFRWVLYENMKRDELEREKYEKAFAIMKNIEVVRSVDLEHYNIGNPLLYESACQRVYIDELHGLKEYKFPFRHPDYKLIPMEGEIWPHSTVDITLIFQPNEIGLIDGTAYLEVTGREERIPLSLHGMCIGPLIQLNITSADLGSIFLCSNHNYEVICGNKGDIPGRLMYDPKPTDFGGRIDVNPVQVKLQPGEYKSFNLSFSSNHTGDFIEKIHFVVKESLEVISFLIKGFVIRPTLHFDKQSIDLGVTALGFTTKHDFCLHNSSLVPVTFSLTVMHDGTQQSLTHEDFARSTTKPNLVGNPKEFAIIPSEGVVAPHSFQRVKLAYTPNVVRSSQTALRADMWDSDSDPVTLPVMFHSRVASIVVKPNEIFIRFCFINFPYMRTIIVENKSNVEGYFYLPPQTVTINSPILYSLSSHQGYLKPNESKSISLRIVTTVLGRRELQLSMLALGDRNPTPCCTLVCNGQGPIVTVEPSHVNWGEIQLLEVVRSTIKLVNDSPIPAQFIARLRKSSSPWTVSPACGALEPNGSLEMEITVHLCDTGKYTDRINIEIMNSRAITCTLIAIGIGTSIDLVPNMIPIFDMGLLFRDQDISIPITMVNKGTKYFRLIWTTASDSQLIQASGSSEGQQDKFIIDPYITELPAGAESVIYCKIRWQVNESLSEQWYLHGHAKGHGKRQLLGTSLFRATFTSPNISFNKRIMTFRYDPSEQSSDTRPTDTLLVVNESGLDLKARVNIDPPFELNVKNEQDTFETLAIILLPDGVSTRIFIRFDTQAIDVSNMYSTEIRGALTFDYETHQAKDKIECIAEVNYPNISFSPMEPVILSCGIGSTARKNLTLVNTGRLPVCYHFEWLVVSADQISNTFNAEEETQAENTERNDSLASEGSASTRKLSLTGMENGKSTSSSTLVSIAPCEIQDFIFPITERYFSEDTEIQAFNHSLINLKNEQRSCIESTNGILDVVPKEGIVLPHSSQCVYLELNALKRIEINANLACYIESGPTETILVRALADAISYSIDKEYIDFHWQLLGETCHATLTIANQGKVSFTFETHMRSELLQNRITRQELLRIEPRCGVVNPMSNMSLDVFYYAGVPGPIQEQFELEIAHHPPITIHIEGLGSLSQVYLHVPRFETFKQLPVEICYRAISTLTSGFLSEIQNSPDNIQRIIPNIDNNDTSGDIGIPKCEMERLSANGWEVISHDVILPTIIDIEMAIERSLAIEHVQENPYVITELHNSIDRNKEFFTSSFLVPEYVIDMGYVVIGSVGCYSTMLINYGPAPVDIHIRKARSKCNALQKLGIIVQFHGKRNLPVGQSAPLNIIFHPKQSVFVEKRTDVQHTIYLEITQGATIPISLKAVATYPFLTAHITNLSFEEVAVGNCKLMPILLRNDGWVPCKWQATIRCEDNSRSKQEIGPFLLHHNADTFLPGCENVLNIYFKPKEAKYSTGQLKITIDQSVFPVLVSMSGTGISPKIQIFKDLLTFETTLPYARPEHKTFTVKNIGSYPVEVFWRNFDKSVEDEDRMIRILTHYYGVDEILLPPRYPGEKLSYRIHDFCQTLIEEMMEILAFRKSRQSEQSGTDEMSTVKSQRDKSHGDDSSVIGRIYGENIDYKTDPHESLEIKKVSLTENPNRSLSQQPGCDPLFHSNAIGEFPEFDVRDPDQTEAMIHRYIDQLHEREDFSEIMKDPVKAIFQDVEIKLPSDHSAPLIGSGVCIIFHGAPFTTYQQAACEIGKMIGVSVLNINNAITEIIALGNSVCSNKLREIIDKNYYELLSSLETSRLDDEKLKDSNEEFDKIPKSDELKSMEALDEYEYKIQTILILKKLISSAKVPNKETPRKPQRDGGNEKGSGRTGSTGTKKIPIENTLLGISSDLIYETLKQRLAMKDLEIGFTVQTLDNIFIKNERDTLIMLLSIVGSLNFYSLFITYYNNFNMYLTQNDKLVIDRKTSIMEEEKNKLKSIELMTQEEYDNISEDDKIFYAANTLSDKKANSKRRFSIYNQRLEEAILKSKTPTSMKPTIENKTERFVNIKSLVESSKGSQPTKPKIQLPQELDEISKLMDTYRTSLANLEPILANWDPETSTYIQTEKSKGIDVWYIAPVDPWNTELYKRVASYIAELDNIKAFQRLKDYSTINLDSKLYSVASKKLVNPSFPTTQTGAYTLVSSSTLKTSGKQFDSLVVDDDENDIELEETKPIATVLEEPLKTRWIMQPDEFCIFKIQFIPNGVGIYNDEYALGILGSNLTYRIRINGSIDIPKLDMSPEVVFNKVEESKVDELNMPGYFRDTKTYDFGTIPLTESEHVKFRQTRETKFILSNTSTILATVSFFQMENSNVYNIAPELLNIPPGKSDVLNVQARVTKPGIHLERLLLCIKNNPQVEVIQLRSCGSKLQVQLEGKVVTFGKVLLWRKAKRTITVKNKSSVPLYWRLDLSENNPDSQQVTLCPDQGLIEPLATSDIECNYFAKLVGITENKVITFQAYSGEFDTEPLITDSIIITGETYDVKVDLMNVNPIDFKIVKVGTVATESFRIINRGLYDIGFIIQPEIAVSLDKLKLNLPTLNEDFKIEPSHGSLLPEKSVVVVVDFSPRKELEIFEAPLLKCILIDTLKTSTVVAECPILISVNAHYAKVKIRPSLGLNFGSMAIFDEKTMYLDIENVGYFPFRYKMSIPQVTDRTSNTKRTDKLTSGISKKDNNKTPRTARGTRSRGAHQEIPLLHVGPFVVSKDEGEVEVGMFETIEVRCCPDSVAIFEEEIMVFVPDTGMNRKYIERVKLSANACIPKIDLEDLDSIFREHLIVDSVHDSTYPRQLGPHSVYGRKEKCLYIRGVGLSREHIARFRLYNPGLVFSHVTVKLHSERNENFQGDGKTLAFEVEPEQARISPMSTEIFTILFSPKQLGSYTVRLNIVLELPATLENPWIDINICGEATVPEISLLEPATPNSNGQILMNFGRSLVDDVSYRLINIKNVGMVEAKIIAEISGNASSLFTFEATDQCVEESSTTSQHDRVEDTRRLVRCLMPEEMSSMNVKFAPKEVGKYEGRVDIFTVDNPYEKIALIILGESYIENVILECLESAENTYIMSGFGKRSSRSRKSSRDSQRKSLFPTSTESIIPIITYKLDFGNCPLNESKRICFKITNKSDKHLFRFEWGSYSNVVFSPSIGYLNIHGSKDIIAIFSAQVPVVHTETQLECTINEIVLPEVNDVCWDDRQMNVRWDLCDSMLTKIVEPIPEPVERFVVPGTTKTIRVVLCATAAYSQYDCPIREINLQDVMIFQSCRYTFVLSNPGVVDMVYKWNLNIDAQCPTRLSNSALWEVLKSLDSNHSSRPDSRKLSDHDNCKSSIIISPKIDNSKSPEVQRCNVETCLDFSSCITRSNKSSSESLMGNDYHPFKVIPEAGVLSPGESIECILLFSPLVVCNHHAELTCSIQNLSPELSPLNIIIKAQSLLSYCHFDIPESDYLNDCKLDISQIRLLERKIDSFSVSDIKVVEIQVIGIGQTVVKNFDMLNPTAEDYNFSWHYQKTGSIDEICYLNCIVPKGVSKRGKRNEFSFTFLAKEIGVFESLWIFSIDKYKLEIPFLFVATVTEPSVYLIPKYLKIKPNFTGSTAHASLTILNKENIQLPFRIIPKTLFTSDRAERLIVKPMSGTLQPNSEEHLEINFRPASPGEREFSLGCRIDKMTKPLVAIIGTTTYCIEPLVVYKKSNGDVQQIHHDEKNTVVDCRKMKVNKPITLNIHITNVGESTFRYIWDLNRYTTKGSCELSSTEEFTVNMQNKEGHVMSQSSIICPLIIVAHRNGTVFNHPVILKILRGPEYSIVLKGVVQESSYLLNFKTYDFGPCYIQSRNICHHSTKIHFTNEEETPCTLECKINNLPHLLVKHEHIMGVVPGLSSVSISVNFMPTELMCYCEIITLLINSTCEEKVTIFGEGIEYQVCLIDPRHKFVDLGNLLVGKTIKRKVSLINKGRAPIIMSIGFLRELPSYKEINSKLDSCEFDRNPHIEEASLSKAVLSIEPSKPITLRPNRELDIFVTYSPVCRTKIFEEKIGCQMHGTLLPLFILKGACIGAEFFIDKRFLSFGTVVEGCSCDMKIILTNTGDIGSRFFWNTEKLIPHYNLVPSKGYCSPGMSVSFIVTFLPIFCSNSIEGEATIHIDNYQTMNVTMSGSCESFRGPVDTLHFSTRVRQSMSIDITILSTVSDETWTLKPVVSGDYFTATQVFTILPLGSNVCTITYKPFLMTTNDQLHKGTIFVALPVGEVVSYLLIGTSLPPEPIANIFREFPARTKYTEILPVFNWLKKSQKFTCIFELLGDKKGKPSVLYNFLGNKTIDVPSEKQSEYQAVFESYTEGNFYFRITFKNDEGEYHHYGLHYKVTTPGIIDTIKLTTTVRKIACYLLRLENPLSNKSVKYTIENPHPEDLSISESSKLVNPKSTENLKIEFKPLLPFESNIVRLDANCTDLGTFSYALHLKATPACPEEIIHVSAILGSFTNLPITIQNFAKQTTNFSINIDDPSFSSLRNITIAGLGNAIVNVTYEPSDLQNASGILTASSQIAGEYKFPIIGTPLLPKPQGPFNVTYGQAVLIQFKNIFNSTKTFDFYIDPPETFRIDRSSEIIQSKKTMKISVGLFTRNNSLDLLKMKETTIAGRLIVSCSEAALSHIKWIYYLRGVFE